MPPKNRAARLDDLFGEQKLTPDHRQINTKVAAEIGEEPKPTVVASRQVALRPAPEKPKEVENEKMVNDKIPAGDMSSDDDDPYVRDMRASWKANTRASLLAQNTHQQSAQQKSRHSKTTQNKQENPRQTFQGHSNVKGDRKYGETGEIAGRYCLFSPTTKFCYKYMKDPDDRVSRRFFAADKIWSRQWDLYYVHQPGSSMYNLKPILLVPDFQVQKLLDEINHAFGITIQMPPDPFVLTFYHDGTPIPQFLGVSRDRSMATSMTNSVPPPADDHGLAPSDASPEELRSFERFKDKTERAALEHKKTAKNQRNNKAKTRAMTREQVLSSMRRGQRYFGIRPTDRKGSLPVPDESMDYDLACQFQQDMEIKYGHRLLPLDIMQPAPNKFYKDVVFISVDVEAWEQHASIITEVGLSTLDTADIKDVAPGKGGKKWLKMIRSRHFRNSDELHRENIFCKGHPDKFGFGQSEFTPAPDLAAAVDSCFLPPYSAGFTHDGVHRPKEVFVATSDPKVEWDGEEVVNDKASDGRPPEAETGANEQQTPIDMSERKIILVGHDLPQDIGFLSNLKSAIFGLQGITHESKVHQLVLDQLDTSDLFQAWKKEEQKTNLAKILVELELTGWHLHNAGNDARYTLEALVGILVRARVENGLADSEKYAAEEAALQKRIKDRQGAVEREERENLAMWRHVAGEQTGQSNFPTGDPDTVAEQLEDWHLGAQTDGGSSPKDKEKNKYPWSQVRPASRDGGDPGGFQMPKAKADRPKKISLAVGGPEDEVYKVPMPGVIEAEMKIKAGAGAGVEAGGH